MNKTLKWILSIIGLLIVLVVLAIIIVPMVVDVQKYKPQIEAKVTEATGRPFTLGGELKPSVFPWVGLKISDLHLGNPQGFQEKDFVSVKSFEVRVKLLPLLSRRIEVKRFVLDSPRIVLEKAKDGRASWEGIGDTSKKPSDEKTDTPAPKPSEKPSGESGPAIADLIVGEFAITNGQMLYIDHAAGTRKEVKDVKLILSDVSLDKPIGIDFAALADGNPLSLKGTMGPLGAEPGKAPLPLDLTLSVLETLKIQLSGKIDNSSGTPKFNLDLNIPAFSPRKLMADLKQPLPMEPADSTVLNAVSVSLSTSGSPQAIKISNGLLKLDDSKMTFSGQAKEFEKPNVSLKVDLDSIDLDRYLPPPPETEEAPDKKPGAEPAGETAKPDYAPLRKLVMDARFQVGDLKVKKIHVQKIAVTAKAKDGLIIVDPLKMNLYQGSISSTSKLNVQRNTPQAVVDLAMQGIQAGPFIKEMMEKEMIEGALNAKIGLKFSGDQPDTIRKTLNGQGNMNFKDGAIVGIDLANMVRNAKAAFGGEKPGKKPRTDFSELVMPFTITNGLFKTDGTKMTSPLLRVLATGTAHLAKEVLNLRIEPKFVTTIKGQGDAQQRSGLAVPVLITGNFTKPKFAPDLKGMLGRKLGQPLPDKESLKKSLPSEKEVKKQVEDKAKDLLKGLPFGNK